MSLNGTNVIFLPNTDYPTCEIVAKTITSDDPDTTTNDLKFGYDDTASNAYRGIITIKLPQQYDIFGDTTKPLYNSDTPVGSIVDMAIEVDISNAITNLGKYAVYLVEKKASQFQLGVGGSYTLVCLMLQNIFLQIQVTWNGYADSEMRKDNTIDGDNTDAGIGTLEWFTPGAFVMGRTADAYSSGTDLDQSTNYGHGPNGIIHYFNCEDAAINPQIPLASLLEAKSYTWGDTFQLLIKHEGKDSNANDDHWGSESHLSEETLVDCTAGTFSSSVTSSFVKLTLVYDDAPPTKPIIKMTADTNDFITPIVTFSTFPTDADLQTVKLHWSHSTTFTTDSSGTGEGNVNLTSFNKDEYRDLKGTGFLSNNPQQYYLTAIATDNSSSIQGNYVGKKRIQCSGSFVSTTSVGSSVTLTVTGTGGDYGGKFTKVGVNWDSGTSDDISDYRIVTLTEEATSTTITHTYDTSGVFQVKIIAIDRDGFRSDKTNVTGITTVKPNAGGEADRAAVAKLSVNRDTAVRARYGDSFSVITLSGAQGYAVGSDKRIGTYLFKHNNAVDATPLTTNPLGNNNNSFNSASNIVKLRCNQAGRADTVLKVWGWCSVEADGTPVADDSANFDHYEWQVHSVSPDASANTVGTQAQTGGEDVYYKSVEFVALDTLDPDDNGTTTSVGTVNRYVLVDGADNIINSEIRGTANDYSFGGYITTGDITVEFHDTNKTIERTSGSFLTDGFEVGDVVMIGGLLEDSVNNIFTKITALTATVMTVEDDLEDGDGSNANVKIFKAQGPTLQVASYDESSPTFTHKIVPININQSSTTTDIEKGGADATNNAPVSTEVTQQVLFESEEYHTYDFDTEANAGNISILSANLSRRGGLAGTMPIGQGRYPVSPIRTSLGLPTMTMSLRAHTQAGYRKLWNLIQGDRYEWSTIDSKQVDSPDTAFRQLRLKIVDGTLNKDPSLANEYTANINFLVIGELVT